MINSADFKRHLFQGISLLVSVIDTFCPESVAGFQSVHLCQRVGDQAFIICRGESPFPRKFYLSALERLSLAYILVPTERILWDTGLCRFFACPLYLHITVVDRCGGFQLICHSLHLNAVHSFFQILGSSHFSDQFIGKLRLSKCFIFFPCFTDLPFIYVQENFRTQPVLVLLCDSICIVVDHQGHTAHSYD